MKVFVSTLFRVMYFPHNGNIVTIDQLYFISIDLTTKHMTPLNVPYMQVVSHLPQVNDVASCPMRSSLNEKEPLFLCPPFLDLDPVVHTVNHSIGDLEPDLPLITTNESPNMYSLQSVVLPSDEDLLEAMVKDFKQSSHLCVKLVKK
jgi:hypothetical protein